MTARLRVRTKEARPERRSGALLAALAREEERARRHCSIVARRLELGHAAVLLLEVACHADAALCDLPDLAVEREVDLDGAARALRRAAHAVRDFLADAVLEPLATYHATLRAMQGALALAEELRDAARSEADEELATWCDAWMSERAPMLERLAVRLARGEELGAGEIEPDDDDREPVDERAIVGVDAEATP